LNGDVPKIWEGCELVHFWGARIPASLADFCRLKPKISDRY